MASIDPMTEAAAVSEQPQVAKPAPVATPATSEQPAKVDDVKEQQEAPKEGGAKAATEAPVEVDESHPEDFEGELPTSGELPSRELLKKVEDYIVLDRHGKTHSFKSLYSGHNVARRVLVIFIRHFFCGNCKEYISTLSENITPESLLALPVSTFITIIGCGDPGLIDMYAKDTGCPFPIYTDPKRALFDDFGMIKTYTMGEKPAYMKHGTLKLALDSITKGLSVLPSGLSLKSGHFAQVGGEFLFEPADVLSPVTTPRDDQPNGNGTEGDGSFEDKSVTWCHRMKTTRDHAEVPELREILGLDGSGQPIKDKARWEKALQQRKGTGLSMASQMSQLRESNGEETKA